MVVSSLNVPEFSVSEFSNSIKRLVEDAFGYVRIRGEVSGLKKSSAGHIYFSLKDEKSLISAVCFRNNAQLINFQIGDGLDVIISGKITTFEARSNYQIIVEKIEIAGFGAILEMIEKRRQKLLSEGLFDEKHKKPIPFFPKKIGVITSPTGAVIEDIKNRIFNRCPTEILLYPTSVQGENAAKEIISAIRFFNQQSLEKKPEIIIIARGGGSIEDLMPFNDEELVRCVFNSNIPIISAIGHETDITLIDYASDLRAATPTAAAEMATPLLSNLKSQLNYFSDKINFLPKNFLIKNQQYLEKISKFILDPSQIISHRLDSLINLEQRIDYLVKNFFSKINYKFSSIKFEYNLLFKIQFYQQNLFNKFNQVDFMFKKNLDHFLLKINHSSKLLETNHYQKILKRGFAIIRNKNQKIITSLESLKNEQNVTIEMFEGSIDLINQNKN